MQRDSISKHTEGKDADILPSLCAYFSMLETQQNVVQAYREALTTRTDFHPLPLFNYLTRGQPVISRKNILSLLEENHFEVSDEEVKILLGLYGYKEKIDFPGFLNYIYPSSIEPLKYISTVGLKKYSGIPIEEGVNEEIVCLLVLLLAKELEYVQEMESFKQEYFPKMSKNQVKRAMRLIKKKGESKCFYDIQSESVVTFSEMRVCLRKARSLQENKINCICRKLSMGKDNFISLEQMEFWLRPWHRLRNEETGQKQPPKTLLHDLNLLQC